MAHVQQHAKNTQKIEDLRAIPWVFSWAQTRIMLPGWYGFGSAIDQWLNWQQGKNTPNQTRLESLQMMYQQWPFFKTLLSNMDMVLAKVDWAVASRYQALVDDETQEKKIFERLYDEYQKTERALNLITQQSTRLNDNPTLARSIRNRFAYLDPLNHLQIEMLKRYRNEPENERVRRAVLMTINGVSAGLRNTG